MQSPAGGISPAEYKALRVPVEANLKKVSPALVESFSFDDAHAVNVPGINDIRTTAVGLGRCGFNRNCSLSIFARNTRNANVGYWPLLSNVTGWGVSPSSFETGWSGPQGSLEQRAISRIAFVIARRLSQSQDELTRYSVPLTVPGLGNLSRGSHLLPNACEIVTPKTGQWPARWDATALVARAVPCSKAPSTAKEQIPAADTTTLSAALQDSSGTVWAIGHGNPNHLYRWQDGGWSEAASAVPGLEPQKLWHGPNGGVLVLNYTISGAGSRHDAFVWRRGDQTKILGRFPHAGQQDPLEHLQIDAVAPATYGTILVTNNGVTAYRNGVLLHQGEQSLYRLDSKGQLQRIYTIRPDQYMPFFGPRTGAGLRFVSFSQLHATRDEQGKVWIWCGSPMLGRGGNQILEGFLVTDGKTVEYHRIIPGINPRHLASLDVWDDHHLVASIFGPGLFTVNTTTFQARHIDEPQRRAFFFAKKVFRAGADRYVLTAGLRRGQRVRPAFRALLTGTLWRLQDGRWKEILANIGDTSNARLATPTGLWLGKSNFHGLWFVPTNGPAQNINWREGLPVAAVTQLFRLPDGGILATDAGHSARTHSVEYHPAAVLAERPQPRRFSVLHPIAGLEPDRRRNLWGLLPHGDLGEWNGSKWISHRLPAAVEPGSINQLDADTRGRIWLFPNCHLGPMGFFNPAVNHWSVYASYRIALERAAHPVKFLHPADDPMRPVYGPNSQILFLGHCWGVNYYDGSVWRLLRWPHVSPSPVVDLGIPLFFDAAGHPARNVQNTTYQWTPATGWQQTSEAPPKNYVPLFSNPALPPPPPPEGCQTSAPAELVRDSLGQSWWVAGDTLYEGITERCHVVLSGSARQPFIDGRRLVRVQLDRHGNAFLKTSAPSSYIMVPRAAYGGKMQSRSAKRLGKPRPIVSSSEGKS